MSAGRASRVALRAAVAWAFMAPAVAAAQDPSGGGVEFEWDAPAGQCPTQGEVVSTLERLLGGPVAAQGTGRLAVIARVRQEQGEWDLRLWTVSDASTSQRSMRGADCDVLAEAAALLAALAIDPAVLGRADASDEARQEVQRVLQEPEPEPAPTPKPTPRPEPEPEAATAPPPSPAVQPTRDSQAPGYRPHVDIPVGLGIGFGDLPGIGPTLRTGVGLTWTWARLEADVTYSFVRRARFENDDRGADVRQVFGALRGCGVIRPGVAWLSIPLCGGLEAGAMIGEGVGFSSVSEGTLPWVAAVARFGVRLRLHRYVGLALAVEPFVPLGRPRFVSEAGTELWRPLPAGIRGWLAIEMRIPGFLRNKNEGDRPPRRTP